MSFLVGLLAALIIYTYTMIKNLSDKQVLKSEYLDQKGLNIHAVIDLRNIPADILQVIQSSGINTEAFTQFIMIGHLGQLLWTNVNDRVPAFSNPIDDYSIEVITDLMNAHYTDNEFKILYPAESVIGLQKLGMLAGWHCTSPFRVGINDRWGSWFAYRAVVLADTNFAETRVCDFKSPCVSCSEKNCIVSCPANALDNEQLDFDKCINYRKQTDSACRDKCPARLACPVGNEYRYSDEQVNYHYNISMKTIEEYY